MKRRVEAPQSSINLRTFLEEYKSKLSNFNGDTPFYFKTDSPVSADIETSCSLNLLASSEDNVINTFEPCIELQRSVFEVKEGRPTPKTYRAINAEKAKSRRNPFTRTQYSYRWISDSTIIGDSVVTNELEDFELEITVRFYRPPRACHRGYKLEHPVFSEEFLCLGRNYLSELRDKLSCICNGKCFVDISNDPDAPLPPLETDPGYFFINDTFYNDTRNPNNPDYSQTVLNWARTARGLDADEFKLGTMQETRFIDLNVSLGSPLQYLHHGNCEHLFVFSQVEVLRPQIRKFLKISLYPLMRSLNTFNRRACYMCGLGGFHFIVEHSTRQLHDPSYLCRSCFYSFNYVDGQKLGEFKAYRIFDHSGQLADEPEDQLAYEIEEQLADEPVDQLADELEDPLADDPEDQQDKQDGGSEDSFDLDVISQIME